MNLNQQQKIGTTRNYKITIVREEYIEDTPNIVEPSPNETENTELRLTSLSIEGVELIPVFNSETFAYSAYITDLEEIKIQAIANENDAKIEIIGNTGLVIGENIVIIRLSKDEKNVEYKIQVNKTGINDVKEEIEPKEETKDKINFIGFITDWWNKSGPMAIISASVLMSMALAVMFAITTYKHTKGNVSVSKHSRVNRETSNTEE